MVSRSQLRHYKEIVDRHIKKSDPNYVNVEKEFKEGWAGMVMQRERDYSAAGHKSSITDKVIIDGVSLR
jgi:hypothetical protein